MKSKITKDDEAYNVIVIYTQCLEEQKRLMRTVLQKSAAKQNTNSKYS